MNLGFRRLVMATVVSGLFSGMSSIAYADSTNDLVQALISKGVLTEEEGALLMKGRSNEVEVQKKKESKSWTSRVNIRGYVQNRVTKMIGDDGDDRANPVDLWSDRSVGTDESINSDKNFLIRRARIIIFGDFGDHLSYYIQPDFASSAGTTGNIAQLRDAYGDINIDKARVHRVRVGQSKVPYGFENLQSSSNRLAMDRVDALNSAVRDERDTGAFYYYTPENIQALFKEINDKGLKHSGNYGMLAAGFYNGQGANRSDVNDNYHFVARATYPWKTESGQIYEAGIQAYSGDYQPSTGAYRRTATTSVTAPGVFTKDSVTTTKGIKDERVGVSFIMYPQPFGIQAEWNWGTTPGLDVAQNRIEEKHLQGGYVQAMYKIDNFQFLDTNGTLIPFIKWQYFDGYNKAEQNAPKNEVNDWELGVEWQLAPEVEIMAEYHRMKRNNLVTGNRAGTQDYQSFTADAIRVQVQYNF
ncbi:porin [Methylophilus sp. TWE2]|uniref:porin n=1 Tax=Methylophilus sp. TWE2 TaxID=1662285 RepID=UPI00067122A3|nr:porin [Methylophilus sp. TWE2]AKR43637.1 porin [Methylophilus sp. TWE2]